MNKKSIAIEFLNHKFYCFNINRYTHLDIFKCLNCNIEVVLQKCIYFDPEIHSLMLNISTFNILNNTCEEIIIKNIIE